MYASYMPSHVLTACNTREGRHVLLHGEPPLSPELRGLDDAEGLLVMFVGKINNELICGK
jgi:hypothetical protein